MLRAPVLMRSIRQGRRTIRKNIVRKLSNTKHPAQLEPPSASKLGAESSSRKVSARARIPSDTGEDSDEVS